MTRREKYVLLFLVLPLAAPLYAQSGAEEIRCRLSWENDEYASGYELVVEKQSGRGEYEQVYKEFTKNNFAEFSLAPGLYRYRLRVFDLFGEAAGASGWFPLKAVSRAAKQKGAAKTEASAGITKTPFEKNFQGGYAPLVPLYGRLHNLLEASAFPLGVYGRAGLYPRVTDFGAFGLDISAYYTYLSSAYKTGGQNYDVTGHMAGLLACVVFRKSLGGEGFALNARAGGGLCSTLGFRLRGPDTRPDPINVLTPVIGAGLSLQWYFSGPWFAEFGVEYTHFFSSPRDAPSPGYFRPLLGAGRRFN
ncbi:MAG: hypothetical protein LBB82_05025 [Treponema sp.]|jgi:hypothetical protein|nr:hypothetical protein [Treponema sp.]